MEPYSVGENQDPPPSLEGHACVYILRVRHGVKGTVRLYVGETESIRNRLKTHRQRRGREGSVEAIVVPLSSKTEARSVETLCIRELREAGFDLQSDKDGSRSVVL